MGRRYLVTVGVAGVTMAALAGCGAPAKPAAQAPTTTLQTVDPAPETSAPTTPGPTVSRTTNPPHTTRPPHTSRPPTSTGTSTSTTGLIEPHLLSVTFSYKGFDLTDVVFTDHTVPPCAHTVWQLKIVITPGDLAFRLVIKLNGVVNSDTDVPSWHPPDPRNFFRPVPVDGPHDIVAEVRLVYATGSSASSVHFGCKAP
jgi:hypothetical protein